MDFQEFIKKLSATSLETIISVMLTLVAGYVLIKIAMRILRRAAGKTRLDELLQKLLLSVVRGVLYFILLTMCMSSLGIPPTSLITLLGVFGLALSLSLQDILANVAGGISVVAAKPYKLGDYIEVGSVQGSVFAIGFSRTTLLTGDGKQIFVPNGEMAKEKIINYTAEGTRRLEMIFKIGADDNIAAARELIEKIMEADARILKTTPIFVKVWELGENSISIIARATTSADDLLNAKCDLLETILLALKAAGFTTVFNTIGIKTLN